LTPHIHSAEWSIPVSTFRYPRKTKYNGRRLYYGKNHPVGDITNKGQDKGEEGKQIDLDGLS
jgi:hypothetical protein